MAEYFRPLGVGAVRRYELPNILAFNFVIDDALGGGASRSLRLDSQGKALGVALLEMRLPAGRSDADRKEGAAMSRTRMSSARTTARSPCSC